MSLQKEMENSTITKFLHQQKQMKRIYADAIAHANVREVLADEVRRYQDRQKLINHASFDVAQIRCYWDREIQMKRIYADAIAYAAEYQERMHNMQTILAEVVEHKNRIRMQMLNESTIIGKVVEEYQHYQKQSVLGFPNIIRGGLSVNPSHISTPDRCRTPSPQPTPIEISQRVLIVGGFADDTNQIVARFIEHLGFEAIILNEQPNGNSRIEFEKFEAYTNVDFLITLLTPDDVGRTKDNPYDELKPRPSQDTIFRLGYLCNHLRPEQMCTLYTEEIELPSILEGWLRVPMCSGDSWKLKLVQEMQFAGLCVDKNKLL